MLLLIIIAYNQSANDVLYSWSGKQIKSVKDFKCLWSYIASFKNNIFIRIIKTWDDYNKFDRIWKLEAVLNVVSCCLIHFCLLLNHLNSDIINGQSTKWLLH